jgi:hypothetical protein
MDQGLRRRRSDFPGAVHITANAAPGNGPAPGRGLVLQLEHRNRRSGGRTGGPHAAVSLFSADSNDFCGFANPADAAEPYMKRGDVWIALAIAHGVHMLAFKFTISLSC